MANIKSAKKRVLVNQKKADRNKSIKSAVKTSIKKVEAAVVAKDKEAAVAALANAISSLTIGSFLFLILFFLHGFGNRFCQFFYLCFLTVCECGFNCNRIFYEIHAF